MKGQRRRFPRGRPTARDPDIAPPPVSRAGSSRSIQKHGHGHPRDIPSLSASFSAPRAEHRHSMPQRSQPHTGDDAYPGGPADLATDKTYRGFATRRRPGGTRARPFCHRNHHSDSIWAYQHDSLGVAETRKQKLSIRMVLHCLKSQGVCKLSPAITSNRHRCGSSARSSWGPPRPP